MVNKKKRVSSGISGLDKLLNGLFIGDNVIWYDDAGILASVFCREFIMESQNRNKPIVYVTFDRSPKNLIEKLGPLAESQQLTILDCFTNGKGDKADVFNKFYEKNGAQWPYQVIKVTQPWEPETVSDAIYGIHKTLTGDVRFVIESLTGMQDLWGGEKSISKFYSRTCPKLYELDTIAYWIIEKESHSKKLKAHINQIAQVAIDLSIKQGKTFINILKAEKRTSRTIGKTFSYLRTGDKIVLEGEKRVDARHDLGSRIKNIRKEQGISQKELSKGIGVTPSNISQIENNQIYPSLQALYKIAETLSVEVGSFFMEKNMPVKTVFPRGENFQINKTDLPRDRMTLERLTPLDHDGKVALYLINILPGKKIGSHFFIHKGEEAGYLLSGTLKVISQNETETIAPGDTVYFKNITPSQWVNPGPEIARILWLKIK